MRFDLRDVDSDVEHSIPNRETWWGYDTIQIDDPDGNELLFPLPE
jgi:hypothetical protein